MLRRWTRQLVSRRLGAATEPYPEAHWGRSAVVFSPHFDDESLGCGGTIIKKRRAGAPVTLAFMADGCASHRHLIPAAQLTAMRSEEGYAAAAALGVQRGDVVQLGVPDLQLDRHEPELVARCLRLLEERRPAEVFVPHADEPRFWSDDHVVTHRAVMEAVRQWGGELDVYEYPVWLWRHWPWTSWTGVRHERRHFAALTLRMGFGLRLAGRFDVSVWVGDVLDQKRNALGKHRSQLTRMNDDPRWPVLGDVSRGEFLECFFREHELFRRSRLPATRRHAVMNRPAVAAMAGRAVG